jgi:integrase
MHDRPSAVGDVYRLRHGVRVFAAMFEGLEDQPGAIAAGVLRPLLRRHLLEFVGHFRPISPNHSFRHYLKSQLLDRDVPERISDAITGHKTPGIGRKYEHVEMAKKFKAISKLPVVPLPAA